MENFKSIDITQFNVNPFTKIGKEWMLITAKKGNSVNTMTASWGGLGVMWGKSVAFIGIRPQRYTKEFIDNSNTFSLCFFDEKYKNTLSYLGTVSGRDENKIEISKLSLNTYKDVPFFEEANCVINCKKLYCQELQANCFIDTSLNEKWYPNKDYHSLYFAEITEIIEHI